MTSQRRLTKRVKQATGEPEEKRPPAQGEGWAKLQGSIGNAAVARLLEARDKASAEGKTPIDAGTQDRIDARRGSGSALEPGVQEKMEASLGIELPEVTLHRDAEADSLARGLAARAFTQGSHVFLRDIAGPDTLAHELTHVAEGKALAGSVQRDKDEEEELPEESGGLLDMITGLFSGAGAAGSGGDTELARGEGGSGPSGSLQALQGARGEPDPLSRAAGMRIQGEARAQPEFGLSGSAWALHNAQGLPAPAGAQGSDMTQASSLTAGGLLGEVGKQIAEGVNTLFGSPGPDDPAAAPQADSPSKAMAKAMWSNGVVVPAMDAVSSLKQSKPDVKAAIESLTVADTALSAVYSSNKDEALTEELFMKGNRLSMVLEHLKPHAGVFTELSEAATWVGQTASQVNAWKTSIYPADTPEESKPVLEAMYQTGTIDPLKQAEEELKQDKPDVKRAISLLKRGRGGLSSVASSTTDASIKESMLSFISSVDLEIAALEPKAGTVATMESVQNELFALIPEISSLGDKFK